MRQERDEDIMDQVEKELAENPGEMFEDRRERENPDLSQSYDEDGISSTKKGKKKGKKKKTSK